MTINLRKLVHRKSPEYCNPMLANTAAGSFVTAAGSGLVPSNDQIYYVGGVSSIYQYNSDQDGWIQLPNSGIAGTFGAGACGEARAISCMGGSQIQTASAGSTTTLTTTRTIVKNLTGCVVHVVAGTGVGYRGIIKSNTIGANAVLTLHSANGVAFDATTQFQVYAGSLWFFCPGAGAVGFRVYDNATNTWTAKSVTNLPTTFATDGQLISTPAFGCGALGNISTSGTATAGASSTLTDSNKTWTTNGYTGYQVRITAGTGIGQIRIIASNTATVLTVSSAWTTTPDTTSQYIIEGFGYVTGTATAGAASTITNSGKTWLTNGWTNYQVRITSGTGAGQVRTIASNTATVLTVSSNWTVNPDTTSMYVIESNDNFMYLLGNNAVTMYKYVISTDTWSTLSPGAARSAALATGGTADFIDDVPSEEWNDGVYSTFTTNLVRQNGRYIYSIRGGASNVLDVYDIAANTWVSGVSYGNQNETITTGSCSIYEGGKIYIQKDATGRILYFDVAKNHLTPFTLNYVPQGTAIVGDKMFTQKYVDDTDTLLYLYSLANTRSELVRWVVI